MTIFGEIERLITEHGSASILRERLALAADQHAVLEKKVSELQSDNDNLRAQLKQSQNENEKLKEFVASRTDKPNDFEETTHRILKIFFDRSEDVSVDQVAQQIGVEQGMVEYHFDLIREGGFIIQTRVGIETLDGSSPPMYGITPEGRKYVVKNKISLQTD